MIKKKSSVIKQKPKLKKETKKGKSSRKKVKKEIVPKKITVRKKVKKVAIPKKPKRKLKVLPKENKEKLEKEKKSLAQSLRYIEAVGRRKTAVARVRLFTKGKEGFIVESKDYRKYFPVLDQQEIAISSLKKMKLQERFGVTAKVRGGGLHSQAEAIRHGVARALVKFNPDFRKRLKKAGLLTRDSRMRERKKFGLKRARRAPQWKKR